jgi:putative SOS response-associated peptidase YedK
MSDRSGGLGWPGDDSFALLGPKRGLDQRAAPVHDRMPVILPAEAHAAWRDHGNGDADSLRGLLRRVGRSRAAVARKRCQLGIANPSDARRKGNRR